MIKLEIIADLKKGCKSKCDADDTQIEEIAMMIALLEKNKQNLQKNFNKLADFSTDTGMVFKEKHT